MRETQIHQIKVSLADFADKDFHSQTWAAKDGPLVSSPMEDFSRLYDDSGLGDALDSGETVFSPQLDEQLTLLEQLLGPLVENEIPISDLIEGQPMKQVRELSARILFGIVRHQADGHGKHDVGD